MYILSYHCGLRHVFPQARSKKKDPYIILGIIYSLENFDVTFIQIPRPQSWVVVFISLHCVNDSRLQQQDGNQRGWYQAKVSPQSQFDIAQETTSIRTALTTKTGKVSLLL